MICTVYSEQVDLNSLIILSLRIYIVLTHHIFSETTRQSKIAATILFVVVIDQAKQLIYKKCLDIWFFFPRTQ